MLFYIIIIGLILYQWIKTKKPALGFILLLALISGASYIGFLERLISPLPIIIRISGLVCALIAFFLSFREAKQYKRDYLKERRLYRERASGEGRSDHQRLIVQGAGGEDEKVIYVKKDATKEDVPRGTFETEEKREEPEGDHPRFIIEDKRHRPKAGKKLGTKLRDDKKTENHL